jgi:hypothetical protein
MPIEFYSELWDNEPFPAPWLQSSSIAETIATVLLSKLSETGHPKAKVRGRVEFILQPNTTGYSDRYWMRLITSGSPDLSAQYTEAPVSAGDVRQLREFTNLEGACWYMQRTFEALLATQLPSHQAYWHSELWC